MGLNSVFKAVGNRAKKHCENQLKKIQCCSKLHKSNSDGSGFVFQPPTIHQNTPLMFSVKSSTTLPGRSLYYSSRAINRISRENNGPADEKCNYARSTSAVSSSRESAFLAECEFLLTLLRSVCTSRGRSHFRTCC